MDMESKRLVAGEAIPAGAAVEIDLATGNVRPARTRAEFIESLLDEIKNGDVAFVSSTDDQRVEPGNATG
jgi:hypothetical protein